MTAMAVMCFFSCSLDSFLFNPKAVQQYELPENTIPEHLLTQVTLESDGQTIYGYWAASDGTRPGLTLLYCHGNRDNLDHYWDRVMLLHKLGVNVFVFDYRGFGRSEGESSEAGMYADAKAALEYVMSERAVPADSLILYGYSLGNVASIYLAAERVAPLCLVAESPFASATSLAQGSIGLDIPAGWLTDGTFDNVEKIRETEAPFLLLHGASDDFVRYRDNGQQVFEAAPNPKQQMVVAGAGHDDVPEIMGIEAYRQMLMEWIDGNS